MKRVLLLGMISLVLGNAYAINPPSTTPDKKKSYNDAAFVSQPEEAKRTPSAPNKKSNEPVDPLSTLSDQSTLLADRNVQVTTTKIVKTTTGCPVTCPQKNGIIVRKELIQKIVTRQINSSNASEIEQLLGPPCSCITFNPLSAEVWTCQWKGDLSSNRLENTINITFEGGMLASVTAVRNDGVTYMALPNANVTVYQPQ